jgi:4-hydroxyphenylpyruvate dioxygenase-like putative hemolysin
MPVRTPIATAPISATPRIELNAVLFEIVERRAYAGFGAANAAIRLAAQARFKSEVVA